MKSELIERAGGTCELCNSDMSLEAYPVGPEKTNLIDAHVLLCETCSASLNGEKDVEASHWYCLKDSVWSEHPVVQVISYRILRSLLGEPWVSDLLDQLYLEDGVREWAEAGITEQVVIKDSNGNTLKDGDSVCLIKDLVVKGANFTAKRGTTVKNISLTDDSKYIEGRVNGTQIVLVAAYLKKL